MREKIYWLIIGLMVVAVLVMMVVASELVR